MEKQGDNAFVNDGPASAATPKSAAGAFYILIADDNPLIQEGCWMRSRNGQTALDDRQATIQKCGEAALKSFGCRRAGGLVDLAELTAAPAPIAESTGRDAGSLRYGGDMRSS
jgi:hypothetical protein